VDKTWNSWNQNYPGCFFGIKMNDGARNMYFRGANKLIPLYNDHISNIGTTVTLTKTMEDLCRYWNTTIPCGPTRYPVEELLEMPVYDKFHSRVGTFTIWVEENGQINTLGVLLDPYICDTWHLSYMTIYPIEPVHITNAKHTITLDQTLHELRDYWHQKQQSSF
jgi:hypothetical protein